MMIEPPLVGEFLLIRGWTFADIDSYRSWLGPGHDWHLWDGPYFPRPTPDEINHLCDSLAAGLESENQTEPAARLVIADRSSDQLIGTVSWYFESEVSNWRRIGVTLFDPAFRSKGLGTEAVSLWTSYLFASTDIERLDYATWSGNLGMCRVGEKLGWTREACFRRARTVRGKTYDAVVYGVLREEWDRRTARSIPPGQEPNP